MRNIDTLCEAMEQEENTSRDSKRRNLFPNEASSSAEPPITAIQRYQAPERSISRPKVGITIEELSVLSMDEVFPFLDTTRLKEDKMVSIDPAIFSGGASNRSTSAPWEMDLSTAGLKRLVDFPSKGECRRIVPPSVVENYFLNRAGQKKKGDFWKNIAPWFNFSLKHQQPRSEGWVVDDFRKFRLEGHPEGDSLDKRVRLVINQVQNVIGKTNLSFCSSSLVLLAIAHVDPSMADYRPDWHEFVAHEIRSRLGHKKRDKQSAKMFREGWMAIVGIVRADFMAKEAASRGEPLLLESRNAFIGTMAECDSEKGELTRQRDALKEELEKAEQKALEAKEREEAVRKEKEALQRDYTNEKAEWEAKNSQLIAEVGQLHEEKKLNSSKEETVQTQLTALREMMDAATKRSDEPQAELKRELEAKEQELKRLQENDKKIRHRLKAAKKKERDLETELKKMPVGVVLKGESKTMELMKSSKKWHISCYPQLFNASDYTQWKKPVLPVICCFCRGLISPGTDLRIPTCGHNYHVSCVCSCFGLNYQVCWEESCRETIHLAWVKEFCLDREVDLKSLKERYYCSWDVRSMPPSQYVDMEDSWEITGVPAMRALEKEYLQELSDGLSRKTVTAIRGLKSARRVHYFRPTHTVPGAQFQLWTPVNIGVQVVD
ncbi:hypothetical protein R1sor_002817 [Riccia sorocarpa]|uniref:RING-type domain-containing protein n=1 Tax=Riccia sorocarpa TaxID=122646 RepID=A0ABD3GZU5_9MARC